MPGTLDSVLVSGTHIIQNIHLVYWQETFCEKTCEFGHGYNMELPVRLCVTLLGIFLSVGLLQYECVSIRFYPL